MAAAAVAHAVKARNAREQEPFRRSTWPCRGLSPYEGPSGMEAQAPKGSLPLRLLAGSDGALHGCFVREPRAAHRRPLGEAGRTLKRALEDF